MKVIDRINVLTICLSFAVIFLMAAMLPTAGYSQSPDQRDRQHADGQMNRVMPQNNHSGQEGIRQSSDMGDMMSENNSDGSHGGDNRGGGSGSDGNSNSGGGSGGGGHGGGSSNSDGGQGGGHGGGRM